MSFRPLCSLVFSLTLSGCFAGSVNPWFSDAERTEEKGAVGQWKETGESGKSLLSIAELPNKLYRVELSETGSDGPPARFVVGVAHLGKTTWADAQLDRDDAHLKGVEGFVVRPHLAVRCVLEGDTLTLHLVDKDWFKQQVEKKRVKLPFVPPPTDQDMLLFTAPTAQLTQALKGLEKEPKAYAAPVVFSRVKP